jgi:hypothetical protein
MEAGQITGQAANKALLFHEIESRPSIGKIRQVTCVAECNRDVEAIASDPELHGPPSIGGHVFNGLIYYPTDALDVCCRNFPVGRLLVKKASKEAAVSSVSPAPRRNWL